jgi:dTDP-4-dehydrorhamnose 3,5-epimerase
MIFNETKLKGSFIIDVEKINDDRGFFARVWDKDIFKQRKLNSDLLQCNISFNKKKGTLRGMHYQEYPHEETKLVRCTKGSIYEVMIDLRRDSKTFKQWESVELNSYDHKMLYVPKGFALGFQTLEDNTEVFYQMSEIYKPEFARGIRWDNENYKIKWPHKITIISEKDMAFNSSD